MQSWKSWCRLCACEGINDIDIFFKDMENSSTIAEDLKRVCNLKLKNTIDLPTKICKSCKSSIKSLKDFLMTSIKTQEMFAELPYCHTNDFNNLRKKYKLIKVTEVKEEQDIFEVFKSACNYESKENDFTDNKRDGNILTDGVLHKNDSNQKRNSKICINENSLTDDYVKVEQSYNHDEFCNSSNDDGEDNKNDIFLDRVENTDRIEEFEKKFLQSAEQQNLQSEGGKNAKTKKNISQKTKTSRKTKTKLLKEGKKNSVKFQCKVCEKSFSKEGGLTTHLKISHSISKTPYTCKFCGKNFERKQRLENHENAHLPSEERKLFTCPHCDKKFNSETGRWLHIHTVHDKEKAVICEECGKEFSTKNHLGRHKISHIQEKKFQCTHCPARFKAKGGLEAHMQVHGDSYPCLTCGVLLKTKQLLKNHMVVHSDVKNYKCNFCNKDFKRLKDLNYHLIIHIGIKPYECRICNTKFVHSMTYRRHLKSTHPTQFAEMIAKGERISCSNFPPPDQLKAINEAAKHTHDYQDEIKTEKWGQLREFI